MRGEQIEHVKGSSCAARGTRGTESMASRRLLFFPTVGRGSLAGVAGVAGVVGVAGVAGAAGAVGAAGTAGAAGVARAAGITPR